MNASAPCRGLLLPLLAVAVLAPHARAQIDAPLSQAQVVQRLRGLLPDNDRDVRLAALQAVWEFAHSPSAAYALPALEQSLRQERDDELRQRAAGALGFIVHRLQRPCPLALLEAMHDPADPVRYEASMWAGLCRTYAPGALDVLLRGAKSDSAEIRSSSVLILARAAPHDPRALAAMEQATQDRAFAVRHNSRIALFTARDKLDEHLPYVIRLREDPDSVLRPVPPDNETANQERVAANLAVLGGVFQLIKWSDERADELADVLMKLLRHESAIMRRGAANLIAAVVVRVDLTLPQRDGDEPLNRPRWSESGWWKSIAPYIDSGADSGTNVARSLLQTPSAEAANPSVDPYRVRDGEELPLEAPPPTRLPEKSKVALRLEALGVAAALERLCDTDPDATVRAAAARALQRLASFGPAPR